MATYDENMAQNQFFEVQEICINELSPAEQRWVWAVGEKNLEFERATYFMREFGLEVFDQFGPNDHIKFGIPTCGEWKCVDATHQRLVTDVSS